jgi:hypothetical protein
MAEPLRHRQTKGAETDMPSLPPPRHIPTLPRADPSTGIQRQILSTSSNEIERSSGQILPFEPIFPFYLSAYGTPEDGTPSAAGVSPFRSGTTRATIGAEGPASLPEATG